jgi:hypothetical protein
LRTSDRFGQREPWKGYGGVDGRFRRSLLAMLVALILSCLGMALVRRI